MTQYIVLCGQVIGGMDRGFEIVYNFDGQRFRDRKKAISHGFQERGSNDFNVGVLERGKLVSLDWMEKPIETEPGELKRIAKQIDLMMR